MHLVTQRKRMREVLERTRSVLLVERDPDLAVLLMDVLREAGFDIEHVSDLGDAVVGEADVVIVDCDGQRTPLAWLDHVEVHRVVVIAGVARGLATGARALGLPRVLEKPVEMSDLLAALEPRLAM